MRSNFLLLLVCVVVFGVFGSAQGCLKKNFYRKTCSRHEQIVRNITWSRIPNRPELPAKLLRMHFHDCFVRGCDGSVLINSTANSTAEKDAVPNLSLSGFDVIDEIKEQIEMECPGVVSCADILALAARDSVSFQFKRRLWNVLSGRRDGKVSLASEVLSNLPSPFSNFTVLKEDFANKGLDVKDLVVLSGGHTIGFGHCNAFSSRLYNFSGRGDADPSLNATYAAFLRTKCRSLADNTTSVEMDPQSSLTFDSNYYAILKQNKGLFQSDAALLNNRRARRIVDNLLDLDDFLDEFKRSMERMGKVEVLTGRDGEIRKKCSVINTFEGK